MNDLTVAVSEIVIQFRVQNERRRVENGNDRG